MHSGKRKGNKPGFGTGRIPHILEHGRKEEREWTGESDPLLNVLVLLKKSKCERAACAHSACWLQARRKRGTEKRSLSPVTWYIFGDEGAGERGHSGTKGSCHLHLVPQKKKRTPSPDEGGGSGWRNETWARTYLLSLSLIFPPAKTLGLSYYLHPGASLLLPFLVGSTRSSRAEARMKTFLHGRPIPFPLLTFHNPTLAGWKELQYTVEGVCSIRPRSNGQLGYVFTRALRYDFAGRDGVGNVGKWLEVGMGKKSG